MNFTGGLLLVMDKYSTEIPHLALSSSVTTILVRY